MKAGDDEWSEKPEATWEGCWVGELCGELLASDDRSEDELWMDTSFGRKTSVRVPANSRRVWVDIGETHIALGQERWAEFHVVFQVEGPHGLKPHAEGCEVCGLGKLLHAPDTPELLLRVLGDG